MLHEKLNTPLRWNKTESRKYTMVYKEDQMLEGVELSIHLNKVADIWAGGIRDTERDAPKQTCSPQIWYEGGQW